MIARLIAHQWDHHIRTSLPGGLVVAALIILRSYDAHGQQALGQPPPSPSPLKDIEVSATPYIWFPWTSLNIRPSNTRIPSRSETIGPGKLYGHLTWIPFMGAAEFREGPYGLMLDYMHVPLKSGIGTRNILFSGAAAGLTIDSGTAMFMYRPVALADQYIDVGVGMRAWGLDGDIRLNQGLLPAATVSRGLTWADPLLAARYRRDFGNGYSMTAYGDVGGFGLGVHID